MKKNVEKFQLNHGHFGTTGGYTIDFCAMNQIRNSSGYARRIRRTPPAKRLGLQRVEPKLSAKVPASSRPLRTETVRCDPQIALSLRNALALFSQKGENREEAPAEDIIVD